MIRLLLNRGEYFAIEGVYVLFALSVLMWFYVYKTLLKTLDTVLVKYYRSLPPYGIPYGTS